MRKLQGTGFGNGFLHVTPKAQAAEEKQILDFIGILILCAHPKRGKGNRRIGAGICKPYLWTTKGDYLEYIKYSYNPTTSNHLKIGKRHE